MSAKREPEPTAISNADLSLDTSIQVTCSPRAPTRPSRPGWRTEEVWLGRTKR